MTIMFRPLGEKSRSDILIEALSQREMGETITYDEICQMFEFVGDDATMLAQSVVNQALKRFEKECQRTLVNVRKIGYRIAFPGEQIQAAKVHQLKARRQVWKGASRINNIDRNKMTPEERFEAEQASRAFSRQDEMMRRLNIRDKRLNKRLAWLMGELA